MGTGDGESPWGAWGWVGRALMSPSEMWLVGDPQGTQNVEPQRKQGQKLPTGYVPSKTLGGKGSKPAKISLSFLFFPEAGYSPAGVPSSFPSKHSKERGNKTLLPCITNQWETAAGSSPPRASRGAQSPRGAPGGGFVAQQGPSPAAGGGHPPAGNRLPFIPAQKGPSEHPSASPSRGSRCSRQSRVLWSRQGPLVTGSVLGDR